MRTLRPTSRARARWRVVLLRRALLAAALASLAALALRARIGGRGVVVAHFVQASAANVQQVPRLLRALCEPGARNVLAVHFDLSIPDIAVSRVLAEARAQLEGAGCARARVHMVPREFVTYRGVTLAYNYLTGAAHLLAAGVWFDYFVNLSGADYPTARPALIRELLGGRAVRDARLSFIEWKPAEKWPRFARGRLGRMFVDSALASGRAGSYEMPEEAGAGGSDTTRNPLWRHVGFTVAKSSGWFIWHRELVEYLVLDAGVRRLLGLFALSDAADEHLFASAVWNNEYFRARAVANNWRTIFFVAPNGSFALAADGVTRSRQHPYYVDDVDERGAPLFWDELWNRPAFFTRKIRGAGPIAARIDRDMLGFAGAHGDGQGEYERRLRESFRRVVQAHLTAVGSDLGATTEFRTKFAVRE